jgi:hypothetical protein
LGGLRDHVCIVRCRAIIRFASRAGPLRQRVHAGTTPQKRHRPLARSFDWPAAIVEGTFRQQKGSDAESSRYFAWCCLRADPVPLPCETIVVRVAAVMCSAICSRDPVGAVAPPPQAPLPHPPQRHLPPAPGPHPLPPSAPLPCASAAQASWGDLRSGNAMKGQSLDHSAG